MKIVYLIAALYLGILGILALFLELNKLNWFWKLALGLFAVVAIVLTFAYQHIENLITTTKFHVYIERHTVITLH